MLLKEVNIPKIVIFCSFDTPMHDVHMAIYVVYGFVGSVMLIRKNDIFIFWNMYCGTKTTAS